jgi:tRNA threonylcarbamoyladenosine biosynthesis protein TsaB
VIVLAIDTATPATVVGLRTADGAVLEARDDPRPGERPGHSTRALPLAAGLLAEAGLRWREIDRLAVGIGPGTFTGLRVGIATARGLALSSDAELVGVSSLAALARGCAPRDAGSGVAGDASAVLATIDARRGEVFLAGYRQGVELLSPRALAPAAVAAAMAESGMLADGGPPAPADSGPPAFADGPPAFADGPPAFADGPLAFEDGPLAFEDGPPALGAGSPIAVGDGAVLYRDAFERAGARVPEDGSPLHRIVAAALCEIAARPPAGAPAAAGPVLPDYLRRPDAAIALKGTAS